MKKILIIAFAMLVIASCKKDTSSNASDQAGLTAKEYAKITDIALAKSEKGDDNLDNKGKGQDENKGKDDKDNSGHKLQTKTIKNSGSGTISYIPNGCGNGTLRFLSNGTGNSTVLGVFTQVTTFCIDMNTQQIITQPTGVGTTPNGDKIFYALVGTGIDPATGFSYQNYIFTGGTGKYDELTGNMTLLYNVSTPTNYSYTGTGTITF